MSDMRKRIKNILIKLNLLEAAHVLQRTPHIVQFHFRLIKECIPGYLYNYIFTHIPCHALRLLALRKILGIKVGKDTFIHLGCVFIGNNISIGDNTVIGRRCCIGGGEIHIGSSVAITAEVYIFAASHAKDSPDFEGTYAPVIIDDHAWLGVRSIVLLGVHIGKGAVLGAGSVATKSIPPFTVYAGSPAKKIGLRSSDLHYKFKYFPYFN